MYFVRIWEKSYNSTALYIYQLNHGSITALYYQHFILYNCSTMILHRKISQQTHDAIITWLFRPIATLFWHNRDIIFVSRVPWDMSTPSTLKTYQNTINMFNIAFTLVKCHHSWTVLTPADISKSKMSQTETLTHCGIVMPYSNT